MKKKAKTYDLIPCPFCSCEMGILHIEQSYRWYGDHHPGCVLSTNPSHNYAKKEFLIKEWNRRVKLKP